MPRQCRWPPCRLAAGVASLLAAARAAAAAQAGPFSPPSYALHGADWTQGMCMSRERQSPVNIATHLKLPPSDTIEYRYEPVEDVRLNLTARGGMLFVDLSQRLFGGVVYDGAWYPVVRIDFHGPAEHTIKGLRNPLEIQLVHRKASDPSQTLLLSVLVWCEHPPTPPTSPAASEADAPQYLPPEQSEVDFNAQLQRFLAQPPPDREGAVVELELPRGGGLDLGRFVEEPGVPESSTYLAYAGSLTAPPCLDRSVWLVRRMTAIASDSQVRAFADALYRLTGGEGSYRMVMPVNNRQLVVFRLRQSAVLQLPAAPRLPVGPAPRTDREFAAEKIATRARVAAKHAAHFAEDLARRLQRADEAYAAALAPNVTRRAAPAAMAVTKRRLRRR